MIHNDLQGAFVDGRLGHHHLFLYQTGNECLAALVPFLKQGLERNERVICLVGDQITEMLKSMRDDNLDVETWTETWSPEGLLDRLQRERERGAAEGYSALRVAIEIGWVFRQENGLDSLIALETRLDAFSSELGLVCQLLCMYDRQRFDPLVLQTVLQNHPRVMVGVEVCDNFYYVPPSSGLGEDSPAVELDRRLSRLVQYKQAAVEAQQRRARELAGLNKTGQTIVSTLDLENVLQLVMAEARAMLNAEAASVLMLDANTDELIFAAAVGASADQLLGMRMPVTSGIAGWVMRAAQPALVRDAQQDRRFYRHVDQETGLTTRSLLAVPLIYKDKTIGVLEAINRAGRFFDEHDMDLLSTLSGSAAIAIENARLYEEVTRRLAETRVLQEVMLAAASTLNFDQVLARAVEAIHRTLGIEHLVLALPDASGEYLFHHPSRIGYDAMPKEGVRLPMDGSVCGRVYVTGQPALIRDSGEVPHYHQSIPGLCSELVVPLRVGDRVTAVLNAQSPRPNAFTEGDLRTFEAIAAQLGVVMENARLYEAEREQRKLVEQSQAQLVQSEKLAATGRLAASLAHEINNPLQAIHNSLQLMLRFPLEPGEQRQYLQMADEEVERLIGMVTRILGFARRPQRKLELTDLEGVVEHVLALSSKYLQHRHIVVRRDWVPDLPPVLAAPDELAQVFLNLVLNAVDAMAEGGVLSVSSGLAEDGGLVVTFADTGGGISADHLPHIFEPFFSTKPEGTGLGLTVSSDVIERHGGEIQVQSVPQEGTVFTVWLPVLAELDPVHGV